MTLFPEVQKKAQAELDAVIGNDRLPKFTDRNQLPYVDALAKEVFRWNAVTPLGGLSGSYKLIFADGSIPGFPHRVQEDDVHEGYYIPKGALVIPNIWSVRALSPFEPIQIMP
jgi:cytochrome P450